MLNERNLCDTQRKNTYHRKEKLVREEMIGPQPITTVKYRTENWGKEENEIIYKSL